MVDSKDLRFEEFTEFLEEFKNESDRAAVILGVSKLDLLLYQLLRKVLVPITQKTDDLFDGDGPLSSFGVKINLTYRLGIIDNAFANALHLIRKIRNSFAHEVSGCKLDSGAHRDRVKELLVFFKDWEKFPLVREHFFGATANYANEFRTALALMELRLEFAIDTVKKLSDTESYSLFPKTK
jgi:hypothetical protein